MSEVALPAVARPVVSIVMVTWGRADLAIGALKALEARTEPCYEVIVVDNASPDGTGSSLASSVDGITLIRLPHNVGFGNGSNLGAMRAVAPYLCFLNSDTTVTEGWLTPLLTRLESAPDIGATCPTLLNEDGTVQEAGSYLKCDGFTFAFGSGDDPGRPPYRYSRDVDYGSAACLLVRRSAFASAGGFDPAFAAAYFEDVDLCLALRAQGWRTVYEPASKVTHLRHGSTSSETARGHMERNRELLCARRPDSLRGRPPTLTPELREGTAAACRDASTPDRVLFIDDRVPFVDRGSGDPRSAALVCELARQWPDARITYLAVHPNEAERYAGTLWDHGIEVAWGSDDWAAWLEERQFHYSMVVVSRPHNFESFDEVLRRTQPQAFRIYDAEALSHRRLASQAEIMSGGRRAALDAERQRVQDVEVQAVSSADQVWTVSDEEAAFVSTTAPGVPTFRLVYPLTVDTEPPGPVGREGLIFFGGFLAGPGGPNEDSVVEVATKILPLLHHRNPDIALTIVGSDPTPAVVELASPRVQVIGYVEDPRPALSSARLMIAPVRFGAGIKLKMLDAIAAGLPFVTTPLGAEGLRLGSLADLLVASDPAGLAERAWTLFQSDDAWLDAQRRLLELADREFSPASFRSGITLAMAEAGFAPPRHA